MSKANGRTTWASRLHRPLAAALLLALALPACDVALPPTGPSEPPHWNTEAREFVALYNQHRTSIGCQALQWHEKAASVAHDHSADMVARRFFDHVAPDGGTLAYRLRRGGILYRLAGETIAAGQTTPEWVLEAWLRSPEHRKILEDCRFTHQALGRVNDVWTLLLLIP
jgi:uncharacterized protein YkwD